MGFVFTHAIRVIIDDVMGSNCAALKRTKLLLLYSLQNQITHEDYSITGLMDKGHSSTLKCTSYGHCNNQGTRTKSISSKCQQQFSQDTTYRVNGDLGSTGNVEITLNPTSYYCTFFFVEPLLVEEDIPILAYEPLLLVWITGGTSSLVSLMKSLYS
eukprot:scaffold409_cov295-Chaetoceros_neogracile.AAC.3